MRPCQKGFTLKHIDYGWPHNKTVPMNILQSLEKKLNSNSTILDMGCGLNWIKSLSFMKKHKVIGVDPDADICPDVLAELHSEWSSLHTNFFDLAIALNSLHFGTQQQVLENIKKLVSLTKGGSKSYITINEKMIKDSNASSIDDLKNLHDKWCKILKSEHTLYFSKLFTDEGLSAGDMGHHHFIIHKD